MRANYYGDKALAALRDMASVTLHQRDVALGADELIEAARDADFIIADRLTAAPAEIFEKLPHCARSCAARWISATSTSRRPAGPASW